MADITLALGSNLGDRKENLLRAVEQMEKRGLTITRRSSIWETAPVPADQPAYLNAVVRGETSLEPAILLATVKAIEQEMGRRPGRRWGPRVIDIDILFYDSQALDSPDLTIPHPRITGRDFVLVPLAELGDGPLPVLAATATELIERLAANTARRHSSFEAGRD